MGLAPKTQLAEQRGGAKITGVHHRGNAVLRQRPEQQGDDGVQRLVRHPLPLMAGRAGHAQFSLAPRIEKMHRDIAEQRAVFAALDRQLKPAVFTVELEPPLPFEKACASAAP